ncbi:MAG: TetR/AcrR family transcriptional regulator [Armatimonadetes bacterium]|nr:TetR/AcrR family transcriptional regulator [Armatimonadota bacterium]
MARPVVISDEQILDAARIVFARDGASATTKDIARQAGVSEGSVFNRFPSKEALLQAAVRPPDVPGWVQTMAGLRGVGDLRANLVQLAHEMIAFVQDRLPLMMLLWTIKVPYPTEPAGQPPPAVRDQQRLAAYLDDEIKAGRLRPCDTQALAQLLFGACVSFVIDRRDALATITPEAVAAYATGLIDTVWPGIAPETS